MASNVDIANRAITKLGAARITSLSDNSKAAKAMTACFSSVLDAELRANTWGFATKRDSLAALSSTPAWGYTYEYQLPSDCLRVVRVNDWFVANMTDYRSSDEVPYAIEGRKILTDFPAPLKVKYVRRETDPTLFDALFIEAFACKLAIETCKDITDNAADKDRIAEEYKAAINQAKLVNAIEKPPEPLPDDSWMLSRL